jgi:hypothetical protein
MKKFFAAYLLIASALVTSSSFFFVGGSVKAKSAAAAQGAGITLPNAAIYALNNDNVIFVMTPGSTSFTRLGRLGPNQVKGNLIGLDFRPADGSSTSVYGLTDSGNLYLINLASSPPTAALVSSLSPRFAGGVQSLMDFNPVVNALRLIGGNDQNFALVNSNGGNLNATAVQTKMSYDPKDVNAGLDPNIAAGAYTNNYAGAPNTLFYGVDFDLDTFVTISSVNATGSSNTGGGLLQTIGSVIDQTGAPINFSPIADIDIFTDANGVNSLVGMSGRTMFTIDLSQINPSLQLGTTQRVIARTVNMAEPGGGYIDIAIAPAAAAPAPAPAPSPTPTPAPTATTYQAENAALGGGNWVMTNWAGFTGTGFVDFADGVANGFVEFTVTQTGSRKLTFRSANGSTVNRPCTVTVNGASVGTVNFPPTGAWTTWTTTSLTVNLGAASGAKIRVTSTTAAGGPNIDKLDVQ